MKKELGNLLKKLPKKFKVLLCCALLAVIGLSAFFAVWFSGSGGKPNYELWFPTDEFTADYAFGFEKTEEEFRILNLTDIHISDFVAPFNAYKKETIKTLIERVKPHLITVTGDTFHNKPILFSVGKFTDYMDGFGIPWAPIFGNHESDSARDRNWIADKFLESEYCIFKKGPNNIGGVGNYIINITENGEILQTLYMMDSGSVREYADGEGFDFISVSQIMWYEWAVKGAQKLYGGDTNSMLFIHIPLIEYEDAYRDWEADGFNPATGFGKMDEPVSPGKANSGMFEKIKELGSTDYVFCGHEHVNNFCLDYRGVKLVYTMKTGNGSYNDDDMNGGTLITINAENAISVKHEYVKI